MIMGGKKDKFNKSWTARKNGVASNSLMDRFTLLILILLISVPLAFGYVNPESGGTDKATVTNITLITGDTIAVYNVSGKITYSILQDNTTVIHKNYQIINSPRGTYFIPDNVDLKKLDMELFNIDYLIKENYSDLNYIPAIMTFETVKYPIIEDIFGVQVKGTAAKNGTGIDISGNGINNVNINEKIGVATTRVDKKDTGSAFISLMENKNIKRIWLDKKRHVTLSESVPLIGAPTLWASGYDGTGIKIAILDTGIDSTHPDLDDLDDNPLTNDPKVLVQEDFTDDYSFSDMFGHGTHVASIAAGTGEASGGLYKGVAPGANLWNLKVLNRYGYGYDSWIINGINEATYGADGIPDSGDEADIISMSLGGGATDGEDPLSLAVNNAVDAGIVVVLAAGNSGSSFSIGTPGAADKVITVGATDDYDNLAGFSSRGPTLDYRVKPDVVAPGVDIIAARASGTSMGTPLNDLYTSASGTSMATPHVAGASAILLQKGVPAGWNRPSYVKNVLISSAKDLDLNVYEQGGGRIQLINAASAEIIAEPATISLKKIEGINTSLITFHNLDTSSSKTLDIGVVVTDLSGNIIDAASLDTSTLTIGPDSQASVMLNINPIGLPHSLYSGKLTAVTDDGEKVTVIFGFSTLNELNVNKIKMDGNYGPDEMVWVFRTNITNSNEYYSMFAQTNSSGIATISVPDGEFNIWSSAFFNDVLIWTTKDNLTVNGDTETSLDERLSVPVSFDPNKPNQIFAALYSVLAYRDISSYGYYWTQLFNYPSNVTTRVTPTSANIAHSYEYYPAAYFNSSDTSRINTPEWNKLYFSETGISSAKNYIADYSNLARRNYSFKTALVDESAIRVEWTESASIFAPIWWSYVWNMDLPWNRMEYVTPDTYYWGVIQSLNWNYDDLYSSYPEASTITRTWNGQPFSWDHNLYRDSSWLQIEGYGLIDSGGNIYSSQPVPSNFILYRDGIEIYNILTNRYFSYYSSSEPDTANYSAVIEGVSNQGLAIHSKTVLNFTYNGIGDYKPPKILMQIPDLDLYNRLPGDNVKIDLSVKEEKEYGYVNGTPDELSSLTFEYSIDDGSTWNELILNSPGNGEYSANTDIPDNTFVSLRAKAVDNSGNSASYELIRAFSRGYQVEMPSDQFTDVYSDSGIDIDGTGIYEYLAIDVGINVSKAGDYYIFGSIYNSSGWYIEGVGNYTNLNPGIQTVQLRFTGAKIWQTNENSTFDLKSLYLYNASDWSQLDYRNYAYTTNSYNYTDFRPQAILMSGINDYGIDTDSNGLYDYLVIEKQVNVETAGDYELDGYLYNSSGNYISSAYNYTALNAGVQNITLRFSGMQIYRSNSSGNISVSMNLYGYSASGLSNSVKYESLIKPLKDDKLKIPKIIDQDLSKKDISPLFLNSQQNVEVNSWLWIDSSWDITKYYSSDQFERPSVRLNDVYSDRGLDTDGNGFYDYLELNISVNVSKAGYYRIYGYLYNSSGDYIYAINYTNLIPGNQMVPLRFDGSSIWQSHSNGTFDLNSLYLDNATDGSQIDYRYNAYTTNLYNYTQFEHPGPDVYEPDDSYSLANYISADGLKQTHNFHIPGDMDWMKFNTSAGKTYTIETSDTVTDTYMYLYSPNLTEITHDDDSGYELASKIIWISNNSDTYYIMVRHFSYSEFGPATRYNISVSSPPDNNIVSINDVLAPQASQTRVPIIINNSTGTASVSVKLSYNASVVLAYSDPTLDKGDFTDFYAADNSQNASGSILINTMKFAPGSTEQEPLPLALTGNPVVGYVRLRAVGNGGDTSRLDLSGIVLTDDNGDDVTYAVRNGSFTIILDGYPPVVTNPAANQSDIPDDTDNIPLWGETVRLNVTVTDASSIAGVTVNLSEIGGQTAKPMTNIGGNIYSTTTNASAGTLPKLYNLTVNATDTFGNSNTSVRIELRVRKNGDTNGNNAVNIGDALRLANNVSYLGNPAYALSSNYVADVSGNGVINIGDALRLANNVSYPGNPAYILK